MLKWLARLLTREAGYLKEDLLNVRLAITPPRRAAVAILVGACLVVYAVAQWSPIVAGILGGVSLVAFGLLSDVDAESPRRSRRRRA